MNKNESNKKNLGIGTVILLALISTTIGGNGNLNALIVMFVGGSIYFLTSFIISLVKKKNNTPNYVYFGGLGVSILTSLYLISKVYLHWGKSIEGWLLVAAIVPIIYLTGMSGNSKLKSGNIEQVKLVKKYLVLLVVMLVVMLLMVINYFMAH